MSKRIYLPDVIGEGYSDFWHSKHRYRVVKGSRGSKKSTTTALWYIYHLMKYPDANLLVVRKTFRTMKDSCFTQLKWASHRLGVFSYWRFTTSPLEATFLPTGQKIFFRGLDDPLKITSITVEHGALCWLWLEEAYEVMDEASFDMLDESIRGELPEGLWKQITLTFNPWNERHWLKRRFFDHVSEDALAITTNYQCNEWLDEADLKVFEDMKLRNPRRYRVAGLGDWGVVDGLIFERWREEAFDASKLMQDPKLEAVFGLDFGYTNDPTAFVFALVDQEQFQIYIADELYEQGMTNEAIARRLLDMGHAYTTITADSSEPKSIDRLRTLGLRKVRGARKGKDSVNAGLDFLLDFAFIIHPKCIHFLTEISSYSWAEDKLGKKLNVPEDGADHLMDALRYATEHLQRPSVFSFD